MDLGCGAALMRGLFDLAAIGALWHGDCKAGKAVGACAQAK